MASAKCAREECGKTVYPIEELKCLDKIWHKGCFKCTECGMTLSMKTYKGYEKKPYCNAHYPKTVPSAVSDTPEMQRVKDNTKYQSQVKYHEAYEKGVKGTKIEVPDELQMKMHRENLQNQSLAHYHGELKKKEEQDAHRADGAPTAQTVCSAASPSMDSLMMNAAASPPMMMTMYSQQNQHPVARHQNGHHGHHQQHQPQQAFTYGQLPGADKDSPYSQRLAQQSHGTVIYSSDMGGRVAPDDKPVGTIADYDPMAAENQQQKAAGGQQAKGAPKGAANGVTVKALYDYQAADKDEVTFKEGDIIVNCEKVDDGWMTGTVQRTLKWGMLPANYVEKINQPVGQFKLK